MMRFGLSDLDELPSLKEFEQLAAAALGEEEGIAPIEPEPGEILAEAAGSNGANGAGTATAAEEGAVVELDAIAVTAEEPKVAAAAAGASASGSDSASIESNAAEGESEAATEGQPTEPRGE